MFKGRTLMLFVIAIFLAIGAVLVAKRWAATMQVAAPQTETSAVVVAALEIPHLQRIEAAHVKTIQWPKGDMPEDVFTDPAQVVGKIATQTIFPGELIVTRRIHEHLGGSTLSAMIAPNMRAVAVRVNDVSGVGGFLLPGNRIDVLATKKKDDWIKTDTILQDLQVLAVDQEASQDKDKPVVVRAVTLEMKPEQAEILVKAAEEGTIQLALRNPTDQQRWEKPAEKVEKQTALAPQPRPRPVRVATSSSVHLIKGMATLVVKCSRAGCVDDH